MKFKKRTVKVKKTTKTNEKWPPLGVTMKSNSYKKFLEEKLFRMFSYSRSSLCSRALIQKWESDKVWAIAHNYLNEVFWANNTLELIL